MFCDLTCIFGVLFHRTEELANLCAVDADPGVCHPRLPKLIVKQANVSFMASCFATTHAQRPIFGSKGRTPQAARGVAAQGWWNRGKNNGGGMVVAITGAEQQQAPQRLLIVGSSGMPSSASIA
jgi:hypothetical protein